MTPLYLHTDTPVARGFAHLVEQLSQAWNLHAQKQDVHMYVNGGMAMHLYTGTRVPTDVDVEFMERVIVPSHTQITCVTSQGALDLKIDSTHQQAQCLLHEWHRHDALEIPHLQGRLSVYVLAPVDVATSKLLRWNDQDQQDVHQLIQLKLVTPQEIEIRALGACNQFQAGAHLVLEQIDRAMQDIRNWDIVPPTPSFQARVKR